MDFLNGFFEFGANSRSSDNGEPSNANNKINIVCRCQLSRKARYIFNDLEKKIYKVASKAECCSGELVANKLYNSYLITLEIRSELQDECELLRYHAEINFMKLIKNNFSDYVRINNFIDQYRIFEMEPKHELVTNAELYNNGSWEIRFRMEIEIPF
jgi:hypothetical protein